MLEREVEVVWKSELGVPIQAHPLELGLNTHVQQIPQPGKPATLVFHVALGKLSGRGEPNDARDIERAAAYAVLVASAVDLANDGSPTPNGEGADALGSVHLVARDLQKINVVGIDVDWKVGEQLRCVSVEDDVALLRNCSDRSDRVEGSDLVVGRHKRDEDGVGSN